MKKFIIAALALTPSFAFAQSRLGNIEDIIQSISSIVALALPIVVALGLLAFFWGLVKFIFAAGDEAAKDEGKRIMLWGIIALFVMVSVWGIVNFIGESFNIQQGEDIVVPTVPGVN